MALFTDGNPSSPLDLVLYESSIMETANLESIDLVAKGTIARLDIGIDLEHFLSRVPGGQGYRLGHVVVTDALRQWHILHTLAITYRDAHHQQLNERYKKKWKTWARLAERARDLLFEIGVGAVNSPLSRPPLPEVGLAAAALTKQMFHVQISWVDALGNESSPSELLTYLTEDGSTLTVKPTSPPYSAVGWNVYVGTTTDAMSRQNESLLDPDSLWILPESGLVSGAELPSGQRPDTLLRKVHLWRRG